jgi:hypothetical protein
VKPNLYNLQIGQIEHYSSLIDKKMCQIYRNIENLDHIWTQTSDFFFASIASSSTCCCLFNSSWWTCKIKNLSCFKLNFLDVSRPKSWITVCSQTCPCDHLYQSSWKDFDLVRHSDWQEGKFFQSEQIFVSPNNVCYFY